MATTEQDLIAMVDRAVSVGAAAVAVITGYEQRLRELKVAEIVIQQATGNLKNSTDALEQAVLANTPQAKLPAQLETSTGSTEVPGSTFGSTEASEAARRAIQEALTAPGSSTPAFIPTP